MKAVFKSCRGPGLLATAVALAVTGLAACAGAGSPTPGPPTSASASASSPAGLLGAAGSLPQSRLYYLTKLTARQLCGLLHPGESARIAAAPTTPGKFATSLGFAISCSWIISSGSGQLMIVIAKVEDWQRTRATDLAVSHSVTTTVGGHPAVYFKSKVKSAQLDVAAAGLSDPSVTFDAPTLAEAIRMAQLVMPRLLAISTPG